MQFETLAGLKQQARLQVESADLDVPKYDIYDPQFPGSGLNCIPPESAGDVYFDIEGFPLTPGGLEYLFGATILEGGKPKFVEWWAHNVEEEKLAVEAFIDWLHARWKAHPDLHVFHYASYEKAALRKLTSRYATRANELDDLLRNEVFIDLYAVVKQSMRVGTPSYSIKSIEKLYREKRTGDVSTALDSVISYQRWLDERDGDDWRSSAILSQIRDYNIEDCDSTWQLTEWLRARQSEMGIVWYTKEHKEPPTSEAAQFRRSSAELAAEMLASVPVDQEAKSEDDKIREMLAHLLEFHWRESKPVFWAMFDRHDMTEQQRYDDPSCLAGLIAYEPSAGVKLSTHYKYMFDPNQDTKIDAGNECYFAHDLDETVAVANIDPDKGIITLSRKSDREAPPERLSLIKNEFVNPQVIAKSIFRTCLSYSKGGKLTRAIDDFLRRRRPRITGKPDGALIEAGPDSLTDSVVEIVRQMDGTTLCIQGPPGSGKTYTAAKAIAQLLKDGKTVGITSNGHKAIANLMDEVAKQAFAIGFDLQGVKLQQTKNEFHVQADTIVPMPSSKFFKEHVGEFHLIGGTAWAFSNENAIRLVDYLFVDEAGQVSVANLVGMAPSATNLVLIGDQMQLSQPTQGTHPGDSGKSVLEYLLEGKQVIPDDFGVFLAISHRMHPDVCNFISGAIYESRLHSHANTARRVLELPSSGTQYVTSPSGVLYVPVEHDGNAQDSDEEAQTIQLIVEELDRCKFRDGKTSRPFDSSEDLLIVAPYNMQVRKLRSLLPDVHIGSVDKFQGQQAPVVIVSMCSSTGDASARGLEFIFSKNRLNVAISRAKSLAIIVGSPALARSRCNRIEQMELVNLFCRIVDNGAAPTASTRESALAAGLC
jgi:hypothetical protein